MIEWLSSWNNRTNHYWRDFPAQDIQHVATHLIVWLLSATADFHYICRIIYMNISSMSAMVPQECFFVANARLIVVVGRCGCWTCWDVWSCGWMWSRSKWCLYIPTGPGMVLNSMSMAKSLQRSSATHKERYEMPYFDGLWRLMALFIICATIVMVIALVSKLVRFPHRFRGSLGQWLLWVLRSQMG